MDTTTADEMYDQNVLPAEMWSRVISTLLSEYRWVRVATSQAAIEDLKLALGIRSVCSFFYEESVRWMKNNWALTNGEKIDMDNIQTAYFDRIFSTCGVIWNANEHQCTITTVDWVIDAIGISIYYKHNIVRDGECIVIGMGSVIIRSDSLSWHYNECDPCDIEIPPIEFTDILSTLCIPMRPVYNMFPPSVPHRYVMRTV
jgi:hypothetical protein